METDFPSYPDYLIGDRNIKKVITTPTVGEILQKEFLNPMGVSAYKLAQEIQVPTSIIQDILYGRQKITTDISFRLARYFGVSDHFFLDIQNDIDNRNI